jgi:hypothetical protein
MGTPRPSRATGQTTIINRTTNAINAQQTLVESRLLPADDLTANPPGVPAPDAEVADPDDDAEHLRRFDLMPDLLRARTRGVAERYQNGCYLVGRPGTSKTHTVIEQLTRLDTPWVHRNGPMSAAGLFDLLRAHPEHTVVLDDVPNSRTANFMYAASSSTIVRSRSTRSCSTRSNPSDRRPFVIQAAIRRLYRSTLSGVPYFPQ